MTTSVAASYPSARRAWTLVAILFLAAIVSSIDRGVLNMVVDPVRADLRISDSQIGLLQGLSFSLLYATVGVPLGFIADRMHRIRLLIIGVALWSGAIVWGAFSTSFIEMFASRLLIGLGEATLGPCALSLVADLYPPHRRGIPFGVYLMGASTAAGVGALMVASIFHMAEQGAFGGAVILGGLSPWRIVFIACGGLGFLVVAALMLQKEPARLGPPSDVGKGLHLRERLQHLHEKRGIYLPFYAAFAFFSIAAWAFNNWTPTVLMRLYDLTQTEVAGIFGPASLAAGVTGALAGGLILDRKKGRWSELGKAKLMMYLPLMGLPATLAIFAPGLPYSIALMVCMTILFPLASTIVLSSLAELAPANMRGLSAGLLGLVSSLVGAIVGPLMVGLATDYLFRDPEMVGYSLMLVGAPTLLASCFTYGWTVRAMRRAAERSRRG